MTKIVLSAVFVVVITASATLGYWYHGKEVASFVTANEVAKIEARLYELEATVITLNKQTSALVSQASEPLLRESSSDEFEFKLSKMALVLDELRHQVKHLTKGGHEGDHSETSLIVDEDHGNDHPHKSEDSTHHDLDPAAIRAKHQQRIDTLEAALAGQEYDEAWDAAVTSDLATIMENQPELSIGRLAGTVCKASLCRIEVKFDPQSNSGEQSWAEAALTTLMGGQFGSSSVHYENGSDGRRLVAYMARVGHSLP